MEKLGPNLVVINFFVGFGIQFCDLGWEISDLLYPYPPKWQKSDLVSGGHGRAAKLGACVNWVDWLRTSADERMGSGRRAVVMVR